MPETLLQNPTLASVQTLMDHAKGAGMIVSGYLDTSVSGETRSRWREHLRTEVQRARQALGDDRDASREFERNVELIRRLTSRAAADGARGVAVFAGVAGGLARGLAFGVPLADRLVVDEEPYIVPLLELLHRQRRYLVVHTDTHRGRLYTAARGVIDLIAAIDENVPKRHRAAGELWGKQQATIARHREDHILHYRKELVREIERAWPEERYAGLILLGEHEVLEHVRRDLPPAIAREVVHEGPHAWAGKQPALEDKVQSVIAAAMDAHDRRLVDDARTRFEEHHGLAVGPQAVIDALRNGQVNYPGYLVMTPDPGHVASRCPQCGSIFALVHEACPYCQARCERANLWQAMALLATRHGITVHFVPASAWLQEQGGAIAVLAREEAWTPSASAPRAESVR